MSAAYIASRGGDTCEVMGSTYICPFQQRVAMEWQQFLDYRGSVEVLSVFSLPVLFPGRSNDQGRCVGFVDAHSSVGAISSLDVDLTRELLGPSGSHTELYSVVCLHHYQKWYFSLHLYSFIISQTVDSEVVDGVKKRVCHSDTPPALNKGKNRKT